METGRGLNTNNNLTITIYLIVFCHYLAPSIFHQGCVDGLSIPGTQQGAGEGEFKIYWLAQYM